MSGLDIRPGQKYARPKGEGVRRVIVVDGVGDRYVQATGWLEDSTGDGWVVRPGSRRRSRIAISTTFRVMYRKLVES